MAFADCGRLGRGNATSQDPSLPPQKKQENRILKIWERWGGGCLFHLGPVNGSTFAGPRREPHERLPEMWWGGVGGRFWSFLVVCGRF